VGWEDNVLRSPAVSVAGFPAHGPRLAGSSGHRLSGAKEQGTELIASFSAKSCFGHLLHLNNVKEDVSESAWGENRTVT